MHERHSTFPVGLGLLLALVMCGGCDSDSSPRRSLAPTPLPPISPSPPLAPPAPAPVVPHLIDVRYDPDMYNTRPPRDGDGAYLLDWEAGWYCVWLHNIPETPAGHCREYPFTFSWLPSAVSQPERWFGPTWNRGCHLYPNQTNPGPCFQSPARESVSALQSITIVGMERAPNGALSEMFRTEIAIRFRDR